MLLQISGVLRQTPSLLWTLQCWQEIAPESRNWTGTDSAPNCIVNFYSPSHLIKMNFGPLEKSPFRRATAVSRIFMDLLQAGCLSFTEQTASKHCIHWRQRRRGCRGHIPTNILVGWDVNGNIPPQYYYILSDTADQY